MPPGAIVGAVAGLFVGWLIAAFKSKFTYLGGGMGTFEGMGCLATLFLCLVMAAVGGVIGLVLFPQ